MNKDNTPEGYYRFNDKIYKPIYDASPQPEPGDVVVNRNGELQIMFPDVITEEFLINTEYYSLVRNMGCRLYRIQNHKENDKAFVFNLKDNPADDFYNDEWINIDLNWIHKTAIIHACVKLGKGNTIGAYTVIGGNGEIRGVKQGKFRGTIIIGDNNVISELVTIQRPFDNNSTIIGNNNIIMAHSHIGHDVFIGNNCEICTGVILGGYAKISDGVKIKLGATIRNRITIGKNSLIGLGSAVVKDVKDEIIAMGNPAKYFRDNVFKKKE